MQGTDTQWQHPAFRAGFSLLEIVIVLAVISLILGAAIKFRDGILVTGKITATEGKIAELSSKLESYRTLAGHYPSGKQGLQALVSRPSTAPTPKRWTRQCDVLPEDPWKEPFVYRFPGSRYSRKFEVVSKGEDRELHTGDDISSQDPR